MNEPDDARDEDPAAGRAGAPPPADDDEGDAQLRRLDELEALLDDVRERRPLAPEWEFCEGFMAALLCCRRPIGFDEFLPVLLGEGEPGGLTVADGAAAAPDAFADAAQRERFEQLWNERWIEIEQELAGAAAAAQDDAEPAYWPLVSDLRAVVAGLDAHERGRIDPAEVPSFAQLWAIGFMDVPAAWPEEWTPPRDREAQGAIEDALAAIEALIDDDSAPPEVAPFDDADAPSVSARRFEQFGDALWAVQDLYRIWHALGPRMLPLRKAPQPGRNDPCWCGSGRKFKKCHGA